MKKTLFVTHWPGGGVWGLAQLVQAAYTEEITGMRMAELSDLHISSSIGAVAGNALLVPSDTNPNIPKFKAGDLIDPFKECASQIFGAQGIKSHYTHTVKHDLAKMLRGENGGFLRSGIARFLSSPKQAIHKPHDLLGIFLANYLGDIKLNQLIRSNVTVAHHMEKKSRMVFAHLKPDLFDADKWNDSVLPNHGDETMVRDAIMASTAAPTVFNAYTIGEQHYVDFDRLYSPLASVELLEECLHTNMTPLSARWSSAHAPTIDSRLLKMTCGVMFDGYWDHIAYAEQGPLAMLDDMTAAMSIDQQRQDHAILMKRLGKNNVVTIGAELSELSKEETATKPSASAFDGNLSNLRKIEAFASERVAQQHEDIMRYAEMVTQTRAREGQVDALTAFAPAANTNKLMPVSKENQEDIIPVEPSKTWGLGGLSRLLGRTPA